MKDSNEAAIKALLPTGVKDYSTVPEGHTVGMWQYDPESNTMKPVYTLNPEEQVEREAWVQDFIKRNPVPESK